MALSPAGDRLAIASQGEAKLIDTSNGNTVADFAIDEAVASFLSWLSSAGGLTPEGAVRAIESFASFVDLAEKDWPAIRLAFITEIVLDLFLLDLAWGTRD